MSRFHFRSLPSNDLDETDFSTTPKRAEDWHAETSGWDTTVWPTLGKSREASRKSVPLKTGSSAPLRLLSLILHSGLVAIHVVLIVIWSKDLEHRLVFSLEHQKIVSFLITAITQTFGTIYSALLVLVTQMLSMRRNLHRKQPLTATHDIASAWAGLGSAAIHIWHQTAVPSSFIGVLCVFFYLGNTLVLHITTPALFALEVFNASYPVLVGTEGLPSYNLTGHNLSSLDDIPYTILDNITSYTSASLYYLPYVDGSTAIGLHEGALYDVPKPNAGIGNVDVNATSFNITCGYYEDVSVVFSDGKYQATRNTSGSTEIETTQRGIISRIYFTDTVENSIVLYSTIPILDSSGKNGSSVELTPPMNTSVSSIQILRCTQSLVNGTAVVEAQSGKAVSLQPDLKKTTSAWAPYTDPANTTAADNAFLNGWAGWYTTMPQSAFPFDSQVDSAAWSYVSLADLSLIQKLNLQPTNSSAAPSSVKLHDLENALSELVAAMFWTLGHTSPTHESIQSAHRDSVAGDSFSIGIGQIQTPVFLLPGNVTVTEQSPQARLDSSIIAAAVGLAASIALLLLSLPDSLFQRGTRDGEELIPITGTGILHAIWLYRNHPELEARLEQVEHPTDGNLRHAGMVRARLVGGRKVEEL
ncbi:hypothetical protein C8R44DRAFT_824305 [Mycena epipterygia]|nr:hypothetical protein C8R44DRAFT_824305 [Mycena epipterygia]